MSARIALSATPAVWPVGWVPIVFTGLPGAPWALLCSLGSPGLPRCSLGLPWFLLDSTGVPLGSIVFPGLPYAPWASLVSSGAFSWSPLCSLGCLVPPGLSGAPWASLGSAGAPLDSPGASLDSPGASLGSIVPPGLPSALRSGLLLKIHMQFSHGRHHVSRHYPPSISLHLLNQSYQKS
jgi:hypothetical protein